MFPPTPTPFPTQLAPDIVMPTFSAWTFAPDAIQTWNSAQAVTVFFQAIVIMSIIVFIFRAMLKMAQYLSKDGQV